MNEDQTKLKDYLWARCTATGVPSKIRFLAFQFAGVIQCISF